MSRAVKIKYRLQGDTNYTVCIVTELQYENFKILPIMEECKILQENMEISEDEIEEINQALADTIRKEIK